MLINRINLISEFFLWVLAFGITFSNAVVEVCAGFIIFLFFVKFVIRFSSHNSDDLPRTKINAFVLIFFLIVFASFLKWSFSGDYLNDLSRGLLRAIKYLLLFISLVDLLRGAASRMKRLFWVIIGISLFTFSNGIFQNIFGFDILRHKTINRMDSLNRICSSFVHPNDFGAYIISVLPLSLVFLVRGLKLRKRLLLILVFVLGFYCLIRTSSRGAWIGFLFSLVFFLFFYRRKLLFIVPAFIGLFIFISPRGLERFVSIFTLEGTSLERLQIWSGAWNMIKVHPLLGFGINTYSDYFPKFKPPEYPDLCYAHNSYLQMWTEIGLVGLLAFLVILGIVIISASKVLKKKKLAAMDDYILLGLLTGYISFLIQSFLDTNLFSLVLLTQFWLLTVFILCLSKVREQ
ncbi:MAG: O-antigen ligase family protein [Candidatus Omnitrophica bacterium]|nr:O-antigen ligase family protein [Candidatus Omnitrophota bacterium]